MTHRALILLATLALGGCATQSSRSGSMMLFTPQGEETAVKPSGNESLVRAVQAQLTGGAKRPTCPMRISPGSPAVAPMPKFRVGSTRTHTIVVIPPGCTPRPV